MNPNHKQVVDFVEMELVKAKNMRPSIDVDATSDLFWKLTGKIEAFIGIKKHIEEQYMTGYQKPREVRLQIEHKRTKGSPLSPIANQDFEFEELFGDF